MKPIERRRSGRGSAVFDRGGGVVDLALDVVLGGGALVFDGGHRVGGGVLDRGHGFLGRFPQPVGGLTGRLPHLVGQRGGLVLQSAGDLLLLLHWPGSPRR